jgi:2-oxoglutarate dehydrogenase E2 component (dihydrolipoamide succinyltransferase)
MGKFELTLPKMGESVAEATITSWLKEVGDTVELDEAVLEIATDKVDSEVPSDVEGVLVEKRFQIDDIAQVGQVLAIIETDDDTDEEPTAQSKAAPNVTPEIVTQLQARVDIAKAHVEDANVEMTTGSRFYSPLVKNIAKAEGLSQEELDNIVGTGKEGRVTKSDILAYIAKSPNGAEVTTQETAIPQAKTIASQTTTVAATVPSGEDELVEMTRMGKLISQHMTTSLQTAAHVQSFIEVDVTDVWNWRAKVKDEFEKREGEKLTFTPIFMEAVAKALREYPMLNISLEGDKILKKKSINLSMAAALPNGDLIVPVIKNADQLNLVGMTRQVNDLAHRARTNALKPDEIQDGTYTVTNVGSFGSLMGTPIINQPQVGILAIGAIRKVPAVIETPQGDFIGIRHRMFLSHSFDHRVVNGALGGMFIKTVKDYLEAWDIDREV